MVHLTARGETSASGLLGQPRRLKRSETSLFAKPLEFGAGLSRVAGNHLDTLHEQTCAWQQPSRRPQWPGVVLARWSQADAAPATLCAFLNSLEQEPETVLVPGLHLIDPANEPPLYRHYLAESYKSAHDSDVDL